MLITFLLVGVVFLVAGFALRLRPPKKINPVYGYRTKLSMSGQQAWDLGQKISARYMIRAGLVFVILAPIGSLLKISEEMEIGLSLSLLVLLIKLMLHFSHRQLQRALQSE
ncbi:MAG: SdpI family protein [Flavobacteriales bacterium]|nr:SdpI family protein [Flavobacteriales bacterium]